MTAQSPLGLGYGSAEQPPHELPDFRCPSRSAVQCCGELHEGVGHILKAFTLEVLDDGRLVIERKAFNSVERYPKAKPQTPALPIGPPRIDTAQLGEVEATDNITVLVLVCALKRHASGRRDVDLGPRMTTTVVVEPFQVALNGTVYGPRETVSVAGERGGAGNTPSRANKGGLAIWFEIPWVASPLPLVTKASGAK